jgi:hypothetical protein
MLATPPYSVLGQARNTRTLNVSVVMVYLGRHLTVSRTGFAGFGWCFIGKNFPKTATVTTPSFAPQGELISGVLSAKHILEVARLRDFL